MESKIPVTAIDGVTANLTFADLSIRSRTFAAAAASRLPVGSSAMMSLGSVTSARTKLAD
jgi:hypothetical protein